MFSTAKLTHARLTLSQTNLQSLGDFDNTLTSPHTHTRMHALRLAQAQLQILQLFGHLPGVGGSFDSGPFLDYKATHPQPLKNFPST